MKENEHVKTAIRWRQTNNDNDGIIRKVNEKEVDLISSDMNSKRFCFEHVIEGSDQAEVYDVLVKPLVEKALEGYDCTFLASGQTGSGKTYTMGFENSDNLENCPEKSGMAIRVLKSLLQNDKRLEVSISFVDVYCDKVYDLLGQMREPQRKYHKLSDSIKKTVKNESEVLALLSQGTKNRHIRETNMNPNSSRSHAVFTIYLRAEQSETMIRESVINLVDLAGSECVSRTGNTGQGSLEGRRINESLTAFTRAIVEMATGTGGYIPLRDSVITYILRDSLKSECYLTLLGCVSPNQRDFGATSATLKFVAEAKKIKCTPQLNDYKKWKAPMMSTPTPNFSTPVSKLTLKERMQNSKSEPRSQSIIGNAKATRWNGRKSISNSTAKKSSISHSMRSSFDTNRAKVVSRLFHPTTTERPMLSTITENKCSEATSNKENMDTSANVNENTENLNEESINNQQTSISVEILNEEPIKDQQTSISLEILNSEPINDQTTSINSEILTEEASSVNDQQASISSTNKLNSDFALLDVSVDEKSFIESKPNENDESNEDLINLGPIDEYVSVEDNDESCEEEDDTIMYGDRSLYIIQPSKPIRKSICKTVNENDIFEEVNITPRYESLPDANPSDDDSIETTSSTLLNHMDDKKVRTPIGKLIIRKVTHSNQFEDTQYAVKIVNGFDHRSSAERMHKQYPPTYNNHQTMEKPNRSPPLLRSKVAASQPTRSPNCEPRIVLHRISTLQDYQNHHGGSHQQSSVQTLSKPKHNMQRTKPTKDSAKNAPTEAVDLNHKVLEILNTGNEKSLQQLATIGAKKAIQIFNYRTVKGQFECLDGLLEMPFWSKKTHERFIMNNIFA